MANQSESIRGKAALAPFMVNAFPGFICLSQILCLQSEPTWRRGSTLSFLTITSRDELPLFDVNALRH